MKKIKFILIFVMLLFALCLGTSCKEDDSYASKLKKIKPGMTEEKVISIMGDYDDMDPFKNDPENNTYFKIVYWFDNVDSIKEAENMYQKFGSKAKYYAVILYSDDAVNYKVLEKEDILSGYWREDE